MIYQYVKKRMLDDKRTYLFFDEIQRIPNWQDAINSFRVDFECDIYVTGSNAYLLSSEYATYLAGECDNPITRDGIKIVKLPDFLLEDIT